MEYYWELIQHDGTRLEIPPEAVDTIKRRMANGDPINTRSMVIPVNQIKHFRQTDKPFGTQNLLEDASRAFGEPMLNKDGSIVARWVKKTVTQNKWEKFYAPSGYRKLAEDGGMIVIAFRLPVHEIDVNMTPYCSDEEVQQLTNRQ